MTFFPITNALKSLYNNVVIVGGNSLLLGFTDRLQRDLSLKNPTVGWSSVNANPFLEYAPQSELPELASWTAIFELGRRIDPRFIGKRRGYDSRFLITWRFLALCFQGTFQQMWISKHEFEESGKSCVEKKCPWIFDFVLCIKSLQYPRCTLIDLFYRAK